MCGYMGLMNSSMIIYPEQIILDAEIAMNVLDMYREFEFNELDLALDVIKDVGPQGHYLRQKHTRTHMRDFHYSPFFHQQDEDGKTRDPREIALDNFKTLEQTHYPEPLPESSLKEMDQILAAADNIASKLGS